MSDPSNEILLKTQSNLESEKSSLVPSFNLIEQFVVPFRGLFYGDKGTTTRDWRKRDIYNSTAILSNTLLAANMHSNITNPLFQWFGLSIQDNELNEDSTVKEWLEACDKVIYSLIQQSNFNTQAIETYMDIPSYGRGFTFEDVVEKDNKELDHLVFKSIPIDEITFILDFNGNPAQIFRRLKWDIHKIVSKFGLKNLPKLLVDHYIQRPQNLEKYDITYAIWRRPEIPLTERFNKLSIENRPYGAKYILHRDKTTIKEEGFYEMPVFSPAWGTVSGSDWGFSPAMVCLSDILSINEMRMYTYKNMDKALDPPIIGRRRAVIGNLDLSAGGFTAVRKVEDVKEFVTNARFDVADLIQQQLKESIEDAFYVDQLKLKDSPAMSATEVQARLQLMQRVIAPTLNRIHQHWHKPLIERTFGIAFRNNLIPEVPNALAQTDKPVVLDVRYTGMVAKAQMSFKATALEEVLGSLASLSETYPEAKKVPKVIELIKDYLRYKGIPENRTRNKEEVLQEIQAEQERQQKIAELQQLNEGSNAFKNIMGGLRDGQAGQGNQQNME